MRSKHKINLKAAERALLTDTLPYELPLFFTNANFAIFAYKSRLGIYKIPYYEKLLLDQGDVGSTKPISYSIRRDNNSDRHLGLPHPISQHKMCKFYEKHAHMVSNVCGRSELSLRFPSRVATHYVDPRYKQKELTPTDEHSTDEDPVGFRDQARWASTYFSYREYSLSHKFFESEEFIELERRFSRMLTLDISRCFPSIYTHSIEWCMRGKEFAKRYLPKKGKTTFESDFDNAIRHGNWNETHGILVGPEFSRVFAEVVLQSVDRDFARRCEEFKSGKLVAKRYVDDYYLFSNESDSLRQAESLIKSSLHELNLHLNESKRAEITRPFISNISVARREIAFALDRFFEMASHLMDDSYSLPSPAAVNRARTALVARIRHISVEISSPYDQFASFALSVLKRKLAQLRFEAPDTVRTDGQLSKLSWLFAALRSAQFLYSIDSRPNTTFKLASIYSALVELAKQWKCSRGPLEKQMLDGLRDFSMGKNSSSSDLITRINHLCAVDLLLTEGGRIEVDDLEKYVGNVTDKREASSMSVFHLIAILFICRRRSRFSLHAEAAVNELVARTSSPNFRPLVDASDSLALNTVISCPYIEPTIKEQTVMRTHKFLMGSNCSSAQAGEIVRSGSWISFTDWASDTDLATMLARKELTPAYE